MRVFVVANLLMLSTFAFADTELPAWNEPGDLPVPSWAASVRPKHADVTIFKNAGETDEKRGTINNDVFLPLYGMKRGPNCGGRYLLVGPSAWICSDAADLSAEGISVSEGSALSNDGLPYRYFFVGKAGASGFLDPNHEDGDAADEELDPGFVVAVTEEKTVRGERYGHTHHGPWVALRELGSARPSAFHGEDVSHDSSIAWVLSLRANVYIAPNLSAKTAGNRVRFDVVSWREAQGAFVRINDDTPALWMQRRDLAHPTWTTPPKEIGEKNERWIDVELGSQTLVAYVGHEPTFATMVSTGRGAKGTDTATPPGVHRIWVKLKTSTMDNLPPIKDDASLTDESAAKEHFSIEDVPYVQFFDNAVALHGAFWHDGFGKVKSHGCVNLSPLDARRLFSFTAPHLPAGWSAVLPTSAEPGTLVQVR